MLLAASLAFASSSSERVPKAHTSRRYRNTSTPTRDEMLRAPPAEAQGVAHDGAAPGVRAALIFSGHLRGVTCEQSGARAAAIEKGMGLQAARCRQAFGGRCDVFLHTWSRLEKPATDSSIGRAGSNGQQALWPSVRHRLSLASVSSLSCVGDVARALSPSAVAVEEQVLGHHRAERWGAFGENLHNFRMNAAGMAGGLALMERHAEAMNVTYSAAVRIRADLGDFEHSPAKQVSSVARRSRVSDSGSGRATILPCSSSTVLVRMVL